MDLHKSGVCEEGALAVACHSRAYVTAHGVGRKEVGISIAAGSDNHGMGGETLELTGYKVLGDDAACAFNTILILDQHHIVHLVAVVALNLAELDLAVERAVGAEQELLAGLTFGVECTRHLGATERTVGEQTAVFTGERHTLGHTLVDDIVGDFSKTVDVGLTGTVVATLHGVVEKAID